MAEMWGGKGLPIAAGGCHELSKMRVGEGLPGDSASCCQEMAKIKREEAAVICQKMAETGGGEGLPLAAASY